MLRVPTVNDLARSMLGTVIYLNSTASYEDPAKLVHAPSRLETYAKTSLRLRMGDTLRVCRPLFDECSLICSIFNFICVLKELQVS